MNDPLPASIEHPPAYARLRRVGGRIIFGLLVTIFLVWMVRTETQDRPEYPGPPKLRVGMQVVVTVEGGASVSILKSCPGQLWLGALGLLTDGMTAKVVDRKTCGNEWWYKIELLDNVSSDSPGAGWIARSNLQPY